MFAIRSLPSVLALSLCLTACSSGGDSSSGSAPPGGSTLSGFLTMTGTDTAQVGTLLTPGDFAIGKHMAGEPYQLLLVDENSTILQPEFIDPDFASPADLVIGDFANHFVMSIADDTTVVAQAVSMQITVGGVKYDYVCSQPGPFVACGNLSVDFVGQTATFADVVVEPSGAPGTANLVLNGQLSW